MAARSGARMQQLTLTAVSSPIPQVVEIVENRGPSTRPRDRGTSSSGPGAEAGGHKSRKRPAPSSSSGDSGPTPKRPVSEAARRREHQAKLYLKKQDQERQHKLLVDQCESWLLHHQIAFRRNARLPGVEACHVGHQGEMVTFLLDLRENPSNAKPVGEIIPAARDASGGLVNTTDVGGSTAVTTNIGLGIAKSQRLAVLQVDPAHYFRPTEAWGGEVAWREMHAREQWRMKHAHSQGLPVCRFAYGDAMRLGEVLKTFVSEVTTLLETGSSPCVVRLSNLTAYETAQKLLETTSPPSDANRKSGQGPETLHSADTVGAVVVPDSAPSSN